MYSLIISSFFLFHLKFFNFLNLLFVQLIKTVNNQKYRRTNSPSTNGKVKAVVTIIGAHVYKHKNKTGKLLSKNSSDYVNTKHIRQSHHQYYLHPSVPENPVDQSFIGPLYGLFEIQHNRFRYV